MLPYDNKSELQVEDVGINLRFNQASHTSLEDLKSLKLKVTNGNIVPLSTLIKPETTIAEYSIYHKNLQPVVYVMGDASGKVESAVYAMLNLQPQIDKLVPATGAKLQTYLTEQPPSTETYAIKWYATLREAGGYALELSVYLICLEKQNACSIFLEQAIIPIL